MPLPDSQGDVRPLPVLDDLIHQNLLAGQNPCGIFHQAWNCRQAGRQGGAIPPFAGDNLVDVVIGDEPDPQRLLQAPFRHRGRQFLQLRVVELASRLLGIRTNAGHVDQERALQPLAAGL
jgi:hypothetical protein